MEMNQEHHHRHEWSPEQEEDEEEEQLLSLKRSSKIRNDSEVNGDGEMEREEAVCKELSDDYAKIQAVDSIGIDATHFEVIGGRNTVYFHEQQESAEEIPGMKYSAVESSVIESNIENGNSHANGNKSELQDHSTEINLQFEANDGSGSFSDLDVSPMDNLGEERSSSFQNFAGIPQVNRACGLIKEINKEITELDVEEVLQKQDVHDERSSSFEHLDGKPQRDVAIEILEEINQKIIELDVEKVIEKQDTYDLYCPNCRSCITKTVILRRRKPKIRNLRKREKPTIVDKSSKSPLVTNPEPVIDDQNHDSTTICSNDSLEADDDDDCRDRESIIFRCLSCFSIFIPTGSGYKVVKDSNENENIQNPEKKSWFSMFVSDKKKNATKQDDGTVVDLQTESRDIIQPLLGDSHYVEPLADGTLNIMKKSSEDVQINTSQSGEESLKNPSVERPGEIPTDLGYIITAGERNTAFFDQNGNTLTNTNALPSADLGYVITTGERNTVFFDQNGSTLTNTNALPTAESSWVAQLVNTAANIPVETAKDSLNSLKTDSILIQTIVKNGDGKPDGQTVQISTGGDVIVTVEQGTISSQAVQNIVPSAEEGILPQTETHITISQHRDDIVTPTYGMDILKSIVYGGLIESVTSLGVVASAAGAGASTVDVVALGLANMIGGLFVITHNLKELRINRTRLATNESNVQEDRYQELLGRRENLWLHATLVILSYVIFGLVPPVVYAFLSSNADIREMKFVAVVVVSLVCIVFLGFGKAHTRAPPKTYITTALYYVSMAICAAGVAFGAGELIKKLIVKLHWFETSLGTAMAFPENNPFERAWASY